MACSGAYCLNVLSLNKVSSFVAIFVLIGKDIHSLGRYTVTTLPCPAASLLLGLTRNHVTLQFSNALILVSIPRDMISVNWIALILRATHDLIPRFRLGLLHGGDLLKQDLLLTGGESLHNNLQ